MGRLQSISFQKADTSVVNSFSYLYNDVGQRTQETWADATRRVFGYDDKLQVTSAERQDSGGTPLGTYDYSYLFDEIGNRETATANGATTTYTPNDVNQYTSLSGAVTASPTYDNNGNMLTDGLGATMTWDAENRMASWEKGTDKLEFVYDGLGRRVEKRKLVSSVVTETTRYLYDGLLPVAHLDGSNARTVELSRGLDLSGSHAGVGGIGGLLAYTQGGNASEFYSYDGNGNAVDMIDTANAVTGHYEYSPFGKLLTATGASTNMYKWSSKEEDITSGLVHYLYRYYNVDLGRWVNRDPVGTLGVLLGLQQAQQIGSGASLLAMAAPIKLSTLSITLGESIWDINSENSATYLFVSNDPVSATDIYGLWAKTECDKKGSGFEWKKKPGVGLATVNGCSYPSWLGFALETGGHKDNPTGKCPFLYSCNAHDICYGTCSESQSKCDSDFYNYLVSACHNCHGCAAPVKLDSELC